MSQIAWLDETLRFPDTSQALDDPNGLLAVGGDLSPERLIQAYQKGIFPWYSDGQPILWWSPSPRMVLRPDQLHVGRSTKKLIRRNPFDISVDRAFQEVVEHCSMIERDGQDGTWITDEMADAYLTLHDLGLAHSVEAWKGNELVGGLYGVAIGGAFFGESMFSRVSGASKIAFVHLAKALRKWEYTLIDCQIHTEYLASFGATEVPRTQFEHLLASSMHKQKDFKWADHWPSNVDVECD